MYLALKASTTVLILTKWANPILNESKGMKKARVRRIINRETF